jgi:hypothetical protein
MIRSAKIIKDFNNKQEFEPDDNNNPIYSYQSHLLLNMKNQTNNNNNFYLPKHHLKRELEIYEYGNDRIPKAKDGKPFQMRGTTKRIIEVITTQVIDYVPNHFTSDLSDKRIYQNEKSDVNSNKLRSKLEDESLAKEKQNKKTVEMNNSEFNENENKLDRNEYEKNRLNRSEKQRKKKSIETYESDNDIDDDNTMAKYRASDIQEKRKKQQVKFDQEKLDNNMFDKKTQTSDNRNDIGDESIYYNSDLDLEKMRDINRLKVKKPNYNQTRRMQEKNAKDTKKLNKSKRTNEHKKPNAANDSLLTRFNDFNIENELSVNRKKEIKFKPKTAKQIESPYYFNEIEVDFYKHLTKLQLMNFFIIFIFHS